MEPNLYQVDAFTSEPFGGNPAAVCVTPQPAAPDWMQLVAREMNLAETAFITPHSDGYHLRWFTPTTEVDLCGHATLASAHILWETGMLPPDQPARFHTRSGVLTATRSEQAGWIDLDFPATPEEAVIAPPELEKALGIASSYVGKSQYDYLVQVLSEDMVRDIQPDFALLKTLPVRGVIVTSISSDPEYDFVSRFFAPAAGIEEDPVTGSAHCCLGPFWSNRFHKNDFMARQVSARGGVLRVRLADERVILSGQAVTVLHGHLQA